MDKVRYGIIGFGAHAEQCYAEMIIKKKQLENAEVTAITEVNPLRVENVKNNYPNTITWFNDYIKMLDSGLIDACIVTSPHPFHPEMVIACLKRNIPVMCEKPAATCTKKVFEMIEASKHSKALFGMMFNQRTNCVYRKMKEMIKNGEIGELQRINWIISNWYRPDRYYTIAPNRATWKGEGGGLIINQACHQIDLLQWLIDEMPESINGFLENGAYHDIECDDEFTLYLKYKNGAKGVFTSTTGEFPGVNRLEISGTRGRLTVEGDRLIFNKSSFSSKSFSELAMGPYNRPRQETIEIKTDGENLQHLGIMRNFTNAILGKEELKVPGSEGLKALEIINSAIYSSWHDNMLVKIPVDPEIYYKELNEHIANSKYNK